MRLSEAAVREILDEGCARYSISVGVSLSLSEIGMVQRVDVDDDGSVDVRLKLTTPGCIEDVIKFSDEVQRRVEKLEGVTSVSVKFSDSTGWSEMDISSAGREKLTSSGSARRLRSSNEGVSFRFV